MTVPGADPNYPPFGRGTGESPLAVGAQAFEVPPQDSIDIRTETEPRYSRREMKTQRQELGWAIDNMAGHTETPPAAIEASNYPETSPMPAGDPSGNYGVMPPDDANRAGATIRQ